MGRNGARGRGGSKSSAGGSLKSPHAGTGHGGTLDELRARWDAVHGTIAEKQDALVAFVRERTAGAGEKMIHGMTTPETLHQLTVDGITYHFPAVPEEPGRRRTGAINHPFMETLENLILGRGAPIPATLRAATQSVVFTKQDNNEDYKWQAKYKDFTKSHATAGDGHIAVYGGSATNIGSIAHEMGHNFAYRRYGSTHPPERSGFGRAIASGEAVPTEYGKNSRAEDFAESVKLYVTQPHTLKSDAPQRYAVIRRLLGGP